MCVFFVLQLIYSSSIWLKWTLAILTSCISFVTWLNKHMWTAVKCTCRLRCQWELPYGKKKCLSPLCNVKQAKRKHLAIYIRSINILSLCPTAKKGCGGLEPIPTSCTYVHILKSPVNLTRMSLDCVRKPARVPVMQTHHTTNILSVIGYPGKKWIRLNKWIKAQHTTSF